MLGSVPIDIPRLARSLCLNFLSLKYLVVTSNFRGVESSLRELVSPGRLAHNYFIKCTARTRLPQDRITIHIIHKIHYYHLTVY